MFTIQAGTTEFLDEMVANVALEAMQKLELTLEQVGLETVAYLRSLVEPPELRPPIGSRTTRHKRRRKIGGTAEVGPLEAVPERMSLGTGQPRRAHPGHWADRSSQLALSYESQVIRSGNSVILELRNTAEYAVFVEAMDGFFVLSGVTDPGGPVDQAFRAVAARLAPEFEIIVGDVGQEESD